MTTIFGGTATQPETISKSLLNGKANRVAGAIAGNIASLTSTGDLTDSGLSPSILLTDDDTFVKNNQDNDMGNKVMTNLNMLTVARDPTSPWDVTRKAYVDNRKPMITIWAEENSSLGANSSE